MISSYRMHLLNYYSQPAVSLTRYCRLSTSTSHIPLFYSLQQHQHTWCLQNCSAHHFFIIIFCHQEPAIRITNINNASPSPLHFIMQHHSSWLGIMISLDIYQIPGWLHPRSSTTRWIESPAQSQQENQPQSAADIACTTPGIAITA